MITRPANTHGRNANRCVRGGILFEVMLSVALFGGAAAITLACVRSTFATLDRARRQQQIVDLARTKLSELEAGLVSISQLRSSGAASGEPEALLVEAQVHRSEFTGLSLVELTVREPDAEEALRFTVRQLLPLRDVQAAEFESEE